MSIVDILRSKDGFILGMGVSKEEIENAERELGLSFATDYREYLLSIGLAIGDGHEFTGIGNTERTNVVLVTKQMRALVKDVPQDWYVIENENIDNAIIWQDSQGIIYFNKEKECNSFEEFIGKL